MKVETDDGGEETEHGEEQRLTAMSIN